MLVIVARMLLLLAATSACGRIAFDPVADPNAHWLMTADYEDPAGWLQVFRRDLDSGALTATDQGPIASRSRPGYFAIHPDRRHIYVPHEDPAVAAISGYAIDPVTGWLEELPDSPFATSASENSAVVFHPDGEILYVMADNIIHCYRYTAATGAIAPVGTPIPVLGAFQLTIDPLGRFLYTATYVAGDVYGFRIDAASCALTPLPSLPSSGGGVHGLAFDLRGEFLITLSTSSNMAFLYSVDQQTGELTKLLPDYAGGGRWVSFAPNNRALVTDGIDGLWSYALDSTNGSLTAASGSPLATGVSLWCVVSDDHRFVYASDLVQTYIYEMQPDGSLVSVGVLPIRALTIMAFAT